MSEDKPLYALAPAQSPECYPGDCSTACGGLWCPWQNWSEAREGVSAVVGVRPGVK